MSSSVQDSQGLLLPIQNLYSINAALGAGKYRLYRLYRYLGGLTAGTVAGGYNSTGEDTIDVFTTNIRNNLYILYSLYFANTGAGFVRYRLADQYRFNLYIPRPKVVGGPKRGIQCLESSKRSCKSLQPRQLARLSESEDLVAIPPPPSGSSSFQPTSRRRKYGNH